MEKRIKNQSKNNQLSFRFSDQMEGKGQKNSARIYQFPISNENQKRQDLLKAIQKNSKIF